MKAMLYADFMNFRQTMKQMLFIIAVYLIFALFFGQPSFLSMTILVISLILPMTLCSADKAYGWDRLSLSMPILRRDVVGSKYVICLICVTCLLALTIICSAVYSAMNPEEGLLETVVTLLLSAAAALLLIGVLLTVIFKWGVEKARYVMVSVVLIPVLGVMLLHKVGVPLPDLRWLERLSESALMGLSVVLIAAAAVVFFACYLLSVQIYKGREL